MCIIIAKPKGITVPKDKILETCMDNNSSGAGFAYWRKGDKSVRIVKGFFTVEALKASLKEHGVDGRTTAIIHFRLATHGAVDAGNCHPFQITKDMDAMREVDVECTHAVAHNGIFSGLEHKVYSDSMLWIASHLADDSVVQNIKRPAIQHLISDGLGSSKLAILSPAVGQTLLFGSWTHDKKSGCYFSNDGYKRERFVYSGAFTHRYNWDDYGWEPERWRKSIPETRKPVTVPLDGCEVCGVTGRNLYQVEDLEVCSQCMQVLQRGNTP